jgi:predicted DNA-binding transcriptional regulator AlpA
MSIELDGLLTLAIKSGVTPAELRLAVNKAFPQADDETPAALRGEGGSALAPSFDGFYSRAEIKALLGWSDATLWRAYTEGRFPRPIKTSRNRVGWLKTDVSQWLGTLKRTDGVPIAGGVAEPLPPFDPNRRRRGRPKNPPSPFGGAAPS